MIPGTIEDWKKALNESKPGIERAACVYALLKLGCSLEIKTRDNEWSDISWSYGGLDEPYRVKPTARPWGAEDVKRHVGFAWRYNSESREVYVLQAKDATGRSNPASGVGSYANPIPGTDPATWDWKKCEVVE